MSKENKLALIVGFTLILVVGVLISDHLSAASRARLDGVALAVVAPPALGGSVAPSSQAISDPLSAAPQATPQNAYRAANMPEDRGVLGPGPLVIDQGRSVRTPDVVRDVLERIGQASPPALAETAPRRETAPSIRPQTTARPRAEATTYTVRSGDSLFRIAQRLLGDGHRWGEIAAMNPEKVDRNGGVREGVTLVLPAGARAASRPPAANPRLARTQTYTVRRGETLGEIARRTMGSARHWPKLYEANRDVISDPDRVPAGAELKIPAVD